MRAARHPNRREIKTKGSRRYCLNARKCFTKPIDMGGPPHYYWPDFGETVIENNSTASLLFLYFGVHNTLGNCFSLIEALF
jgi:hypothetical protein